MYFTPEIASFAETADGDAALPARGVLGGDTPRVLAVRVDVERLRVLEVGRAGDDDLLRAGGCGDREDDVAARDVLGIGDRRARSLLVLALLHDAHARRAAGRR